jgi:hypothetical protein
VGHNDNITLEQLREVVDYTTQHRDDRTAPFDVIVEGHTPDASARTDEVLALYAEIGLTWWVEKLGCPWLRRRDADARCGRAAFLLSPF